MSNCELCSEETRPIRPQLEEHKNKEVCVACEHIQDYESN